MVVLGAAGWLCLLFPITSHAHGEGRLGSVDFAVSCSDGTREPFKCGSGDASQLLVPTVSQRFQRNHQGGSCVRNGVLGSRYGRAHQSSGRCPAAALTKRGAAAIEQARAVGGKTDRERDFIAAMEVYYSGWDKVDYAARVLAYEKTMEEMARRYPADDEVALFYALALNEGIAVSSCRQDVFEAHPGRGESVTRCSPGIRAIPGALHYQIHSYDYSGIGNARHRRSQSVCFNSDCCAPCLAYAFARVFDARDVEGIGRVKPAALGVAKAYVPRHGISALTRISRWAGPPGPSVW
jgi:hypothetical protein